MFFGVCLGGMVYRRLSTFYWKQKHTLMKFSSFSLIRAVLKTVIAIEIKIVLNILHGK